MSLGKKIITYIKLLLCLLIYQANAHIKDEGLPLEYMHLNFTTKDGLPSNETYCIFQDSKGYIWIGTDRGLVKYDGYEFKSFTTFDGLLSNVILAITEDEIGNIWYSTLNAKIGYINSLNEFGTFQYQSKIDSVLFTENKVNYHFNKLTIDSNHTFYLSLSEMGYCNIDQKGEIEYSIEGGISSNSIHITNKPKYNVFKYKSIIKDKEHRYLYLNNKLIGKSNLRDINFDYRPFLLRKLDTLYLYEGSFFTKISIEGKIYDKYLLDKKTLVYQIGHQYLYNVLDPENNNLQGDLFLSNSPEAINSQQKILKGVYVSYVFVDNNEGIWISTLRNGIYYFPSLEHMISSPTSINGIIPVKGNKLFINSLRYDAYQYEGIDKKLVNREILQLSEIDFDKLYSRSINSNYYVEIGGVIRERYGRKDREINVLGVQKDTNGTYYYWMPNYSFELTKDSVNIKWSPELNLNRLQSFFFKNENLKFYGSHKGFFKEEHDTITQLKLDFCEDCRISNIVYIKEINKFLLAVLGEGIVILDDEYNILQRITTNEGLASNTINHIFIDQSLTVWIGTNNGINTLTVGDSTYNVKSIFGSALVLPSPNIHQIYKEDSTLFVGTDYGLAIVNLNNWRKDSTESMIIQVEQIKVSDDILPKSKSFELEYDQNDIEISYLGIAYNQHGKLNYRYRLLGLSKDWINTAERKAAFLQLRPGSYSFELQVKNEYGDWIKHNETYTFTIDKPYWEAWWFRLLILTILVIIIFYYISNLKQQQQFLIQEKNLLEDKQKLSDELNESQQKALSSQLNPHFVFNSLNSIQNFILTKRTELSSDYLSMFSKLMRFVFENSKKLYVPLSDEIEALNLYLELEQVRHNHKFEFSIEYNNINTNKINIPALLIQPMIENAIWHGLLHKEENDRLLVITFSIDNTHLYITVIDNGVGRQFSNSNPKSKFIKKQKSSGVELTKQRLRLLSESTGLKTKFKIIDLLDDKGKANGTQVLISIPLNLESD